MEIFQKVNNGPQSVCQILRTIIIEIVITNHVAGHFALHPAGIALP